MSTTEITGSGPASGLDELRALAAAARKGPWDVEEARGQVTVRAGTARGQIDQTSGEWRLPAAYLAVDLIHVQDLDGWEDDAAWEDEQRRADARFIAAARTAVPALIEQVGGLRGALADVRALAAELAERGEAPDVRARLDAAVAVAEQACTPGAVADVLTTGVMRDRVLVGAVRG